MTYTPPDKSKLAEILRAQGDDDDAIARNLGGYTPPKTRGRSKPKPETVDKLPGDPINPEADAEAAGLALTKPDEQ